MPQGFNWKTSYCKLCRSKERDFLRVGGRCYAQCRKCRTTLGWPVDDMPKDYAWTVICDQGKHQGKQLKNIPNDYLEWMYNHADVNGFELNLALKTIME